MTKLGFARLPLPATVIAGAAALLLAGCTAAAPVADEATASSDVKSGGTLVYVDSRYAASFAPQQFAAWEVSAVTENILDTLVYVDPTDGQVYPYLAESWEVADDGLTYRLTLRDGVTFSNGEPLDAQVVANNLQVLGKGDESKGITGLSSQLKGYDSTTVLGDLELEITLSQPNAGFLRNLGYLNAGIVAQSTLDLGKEEQSRLENLIGTGPFVVDSYEQDKQIVLKKREGYAWPSGVAEHQGEAYLDEIVIVTVTEGSARTGTLSSGQADAGRDIPIQDEASLTSQGFNYYPAVLLGGARELEISPNASEILSDKNIRLAIQHGIDREELLQTVYSDNWSVATSPLDSNTPGYIDLSAEIAYDEDLANSLLDEAGWTERDADGIRQKDGQSLSFDLYPDSNWIAADADTELVSRQLLRIGIDAQVKTGDTSVLSAVRSDPASPISYQHSSANDVNALWQRYRSTGVAWSDPAFDEILDGISTTLDEQERLGYIEQAQQYLIDNALVIPLQQHQQSFVTADYVHGFRTTTLGRPAFYDVWLDK